MKILAISPSWIGDTMISHVLYRTLHIRYPQVIIDVMAPTWCYPLLSRMQEIRESIIMPIGHGMLKFNERRKIGHRLREKHYTHAYVLPNSFKSALIPFFAGIPYRIGWCGEMRYGLLNDIRILNKKSWPLMVERYAALAYDKNLVRRAQDLPKPLLYPQLYVFESEKIQVLNALKLSLDRQIIGFCPGSEYGPAKCWPYYHYAALAQQLIEESYQILIFGSKKDYNLGNRIVLSLNKNQRFWCKNLAGKTQLQDVVALIATCKVVVTNDSGLMHIAAALNCPVVALFGPSSPNFTPPLSDKARVIRLITGYYKVHKGDAEWGYHQSLIDISPHQVLDELNNHHLKKIE